MQCFRVSYDVVLPLRWVRAVHGARTGTMHGPVRAKKAENARMGPASGPVRAPRSEDSSRTLLSCGRFQGHVVLISCTLL